MKKSGIAFLTAGILLFAMLLGMTSFAFAEGREEPGPMTFSGLTVCDNDECRIDITRINPNGTWGYTVYAQFVNKSEEVAYSFWVESAFVDGWEADPYFSMVLEPGESREGEILFPIRFVEKVGITFYTDIEMNIIARDVDGMDEAVAEENVHVYPYGKDAAEVFVREPLDTDVVLVDNKNIKVVAINGEKDDNWAYTLNLYIENKSKTDFTLMMDEVMVNGCDADPYFLVEVHAGKNMFAQVGWFEDDFEYNEITEVETIDFLLSAFDAENWESEGLVEDYFTLYMEE